MRKKEFAILYSTQVTAQVYGLYPAQESLAVGVSGG